ncbi:MAG: hypothetical protein RIR79_2080 [Pseudomonadota bacterium]|jgi:malonyl-CoA O-methyltransferase
MLAPTDFIDPIAANRCALRVLPQSPWLHEEVARRMEERLEWIKLQPAQWVHWNPLHGGMQIHAALTKRYPQANCYILHATAAQTRAAQSQMALPWWKGLLRPKQHFAELNAPVPPVDMLWANMVLHNEANPQALIAQWLELLQPNGFLMFSGLGPNTLRELRKIYQNLGWLPPAHSFTDMHDWGDRLVQSGFSDPVMDTERLTLTFQTPERLLVELRELGRNLHPERFSGLRGRRWYQELLTALDQTRNAEGAFTLNFEIIYGHAVRGVQRIQVSDESRISLHDMRSVLGMKKS